MVKDPIKVEKCTKNYIQKYKFKNNQELYKIDHDLLKTIIFDCADFDKTMYDKISNYEKYDSYIIYDEYNEVEYLDVDNNTIGYEETKKIKKSKNTKQSKQSKNTKQSKQSKNTKKSKKSKQLKNSKQSKNPKKSKKIKTS